MNSKLILDKDYKNWIGQLSNRYRIAQIKASVAVNTEMLQFYWELGRDIVELQSENRYGSKFFETLSRDLKSAIPEAKGLSARNLKYIKRFYLMYLSIWQQLVADLCKIPWGHHTLLIDKYFNEPKTALFYVRETIGHG